MRKVIAITGFVIIFVAGVAFSAINIEPVSINYYSGSITLPLAVALIFSLATGVMVGTIAMYVGGLRLRYVNRRLNKKLVLYGQQINDLQAQASRCLPKIINKT